MIKPIFSEKSLLEAKKNRYTFSVPRDFTKNKIREVVESLFSVKVVRVSTVNKKGTQRRTVRGKTVNTPATKKAVVTLVSGQTIGLFQESTKKEKPKAKKTKKS